MWTGHPKEAVQLRSTRGLAPPRRTISTTLDDRLTAAFPTLFNPNVCGTEAPDSRERGKHE